MNRRTAIKLTAGVLAMGAVAWLFVASLGRTNRSPYHVDAAGLSSWTLIAGDAGEPGVVALQAAQAMSGDLFRQIFQRTMQSLTAPLRPAIPLVLQGEYADSLQGVMSVDNLMQIARLVGVQEARFDPVCVGVFRRTEGGRTHALHGGIGRLSTRSRGQASSRDRRRVRRVRSAGGPCARWRQDRGRRR